VLNHGLPGFNVEPDGSLYLSLMRSCSGWPSGVWIDPPRRSAPDGSNFQFQHWSHSFEYALIGSAGDWRQGQIARRGHEYNNPLIARVVDAHRGDLPASAGFLEVQPSSVVATVVKPAGNGAARMASFEVDPTEGIVVRLYESSGVPTKATVRFHWRLEGAELTDLLEERTRVVEVEGERVAVPLEPFEIVTLRARPHGLSRVSATRPELAPRAESAQPVFADYWLHNRGAAPMGYQPVAVQIRPSYLEGGGPFRLPVTVASERTDEPVAGTVAITVPDGWAADPPERLFRLAPGAHLAFEATITPGPSARPARYFVAASVTDEGGQVHEDVVTLDLQTEAIDAGRDAGDTDGTNRSAGLARAVHRALRTAGGASDVADGKAAWARTALDGELGAELIDAAVHVRAGQQGRIRLALRNLVASEIRGEAQLISPHETWPAISPWTLGFAVAPGQDEEVTFAVEPPINHPGGTYWALVKVMYFGRCLYTASIPVEITPVESAAPVGELAAATSASLQP
jgi:hypothetical protein